MALDIYCTTTVPLWSAEVSAQYSSAQFKFAHQTLSSRQAFFASKLLKVVHQSAGPEQAVHWLAEHEHDALGGDVVPPPLVGGNSPVPSIKLQGAGVAGILRREAQLAARNDE